VLVVGAGGIGCELVKNLVLTGFEDITMIDLDTIDYSNLNRQFLFRAHHVNRSKAMVAREAVLEFPHDGKLEIKAEHGNIKEARFGPDFFSKFNIVLNALDNVDARRHVNRVCLATGVPLIESGTMGYIGQVRAIIKGRTKCYECDPVAPPKSYPICTIRNHPDKPVHCIAWAKELLFKKIFSGQDTDLVDTTEEGEEGEKGAEGAASAGVQAPAQGSLHRHDGESAQDYAKRVFRTVFEADVQRLLNMATLWKERKAPVKIFIDSMSIPDATALADVEQRVWTVEESAAMMLSAIERILANRPGEVGSLSFDKDDPDALDFVTAASNLRSAVFHIPLLSRWDIKEIAGNIVPAIATTNAIIAGFIVLEALKVLRGDVDSCRYCVCNRLPSGRKRDVLLPTTALEEPNSDCFVCAGSTSVLELDTSRFTVGMFIEEVVKKHLSFHKPTVDLVNEVDSAVNPLQLCEGDDEDLDEEERAEFDRWLEKPLNQLPVKLGPGVVFTIDDTNQQLKCKISVSHVELDEEKHPSGFHFTSGAPTPQPPMVRNVKTASEDNNKRQKTSGGSVVAAVVAEEDDGIVVLD